jgi:hypothetical protein
LPESKHRRRGRGGPKGRRLNNSLQINQPQKKKANYLYIVASAFIAILVIAGFALGSVNFSGSGSAVRDGSSDKYVQGIGEQQSVMPTRNHVPLSQSVDYNTTPPTSGDHWERPANCDFYPDGLPDEQITHNLEHGQIVVSYNLTASEEVDQLRDAVNNSELSHAWGLIRFYDQIPEGTLAIAAWGVLDTIHGIDPDRIKKFFNAYSGNLGPEKFTC